MSRLLVSTPALLRDLTLAPWFRDYLGRLERDSGGAVDWADVGNTPTTLAGYGITDAAPADSPTFTGRITEQVFAVSGTTPALDPLNGTIQTWALTANSSPTFAAGFVAGSSFTLMVDDGSAHTITWPTITWVGGSAPTLALTGYTVIELWRVGSVYYGTWRA